MGIVVGALALALVVVFLTTRPPADDFQAGRPGPEVTVAVSEGQTLAEIGATLVDGGVIKSMAAFLRAIEANPDAVRIQPGGHRVDTEIPAALAIKQMLDRSRISGLLTLFEGIRLSQVIDRLEGFGFKPDEIERAMQAVAAPYPRAESLEGFLLPGQYAFVPTATAEDALAAMLARFQRAAEQVELASAAAALGLTAHQGVIVASLVQAEGEPDDYPKILRVILNRLKIGMALQLDATVLYALDRFGDVRVSTRDLQVNSPYNTYRYPGLPPGPINNPGVEALASLRQPAEGDWLYYITVKPGDTRFTRSHDQLVKWKVEFRRNYEAGLFE